MTVTLIDGRQVASDSPEWRDECLRRAVHVFSLLEHARAGRREAWAQRLAQIAIDDGHEARNRVRSEFDRQWARESAA